MKVFITGGTGFVGTQIITDLLQAGHEVRALVRKRSEHGSSHLPSEARILEGDVIGPELASLMEGADAVIHLVGIIREFPSRGVTFEKLHAEATRNVIRAMQESGIKRLVHMSALGAGPDAPIDYFRTKWEAENAVRNSELDYTIFKPSAIFGPGDEFVNMLAGQVKMMPVVPVIGDGEYRLQPISVKDVSRGFVKALSMDNSIGRAYEAGGPKELSYNELLDQIAQALGKPSARKIHFPLALMKPAIRLLENFPFFPITSGQLSMLLMNNVCDPQPFYDAFGPEATGFGDGIREYLASK